MVPVASACKVCVITPGAVTGSALSPRGPENKKKPVKYAIKHLSKGLERSVSFMCVKLFYSNMKKK
jgi:hypothetical protein